MTTHKATLSRYKEATIEENVSLPSSQRGDLTELDLFQADEEVAARCETVLNTTMAEMEIYHAQKGEDFETLMKDHIDGEIAFYEQVRLANRLVMACY